MDKDPELNAAGAKVPKDKLASMTAEVNGLSGIMAENVDRLIARGQRMEYLEEKAEELQAGAEQFKHTSQKVARSYRWKNVKLVVVIVIVVLIIGLIIVLLATGVIPTSRHTRD